ncbi:energy-coupled thiamine transporter ThiT [Metallumcola ferriviriculae]|uniref:Energy-coupled thiamine transporter ThiT n=1 Tax=Metallumcola ferriviriculae TaxID=3039180 RepID=A0AAU0UNB7_9FIRM|nr:energy-coupled thiamine transporter ThiT [Desulfitibacteraceae bacterium MK1]
MVIPQALVGLWFYFGGQIRGGVTLKNIRMMVETGMLVGLAMALNMLKLFEMPQGGSVSLEMIPIFILAIRWGTGTGLIGGLLFGVGQLLLGAKIYYPMQALLDYPIAFTLLGLTGLWRKHFYFGITAATLARGFAHVLSGVIFFAEYTPVGQNVWIYSLIYNGSYLLPELVLSVSVMAILTKQKGFMQEMQPMSQ